MPKNVHLLISRTNKAILKIRQARLQRYVIQKFQMYKLDLEKAKETRNQIANIHWIIEKAREFQKNIYFCFIGYTKAFGCVDHNKLWKILKDVGIPDHLISLLRNLYAGQEATELDMEQWTGSKLGKENVKAVYCHPAYLTYVQSISCKYQARWCASWKQDCQGKYQ